MRFTAHLLDGDARFFLSSQFLRTQTAAMTPQVNVANKLQQPF